MVIFDIPQKSNQWLLERLHRLTASEYSKVLTSTGKFSTSQACDKYILGLIAGIYLDRDEFLRKTENMDDWEVVKYLQNFNGQRFVKNVHIDRGNDNEHLAIAALSERTGMHFEDVGFCVMGDDENGVVGFSPDGLYYEGGKPKYGGEVKCPTLHTYFDYINHDVLPAEYEMQVKGSLAASDLDRWEFGCFFKDMPLFHKTIYRDKTVDTIQQAFFDFEDRYSELFEKTQQSLARLKEDTLTTEIL